MKLQKRNYTKLQCHSIEIHFLFHYLMKSAFDVAFLNFRKQTPVFVKNVKKVSVVSLHYFLCQQLLQELVIYILNDFCKLYFSFS